MPELASLHTVRCRPPCGPLRLQGLLQPGHQACLDSALLCERGCACAGAPGAVGGGVEAPVAADGAAEQRLLLLLGPGARLGDPRFHGALRWGHISAACAPRLHCLFASAAVSSQQLVLMPVTSLPSSAHNAAQAAFIAATVKQRAAAGPSSETSPESCQQSGHPTFLERRGQGVVPDRQAGPA